MAMLFLASGPDMPIVPASKRAIVTLLYGEAYRAQWERVAMKGWLVYAEKNGYDLILVVGPLESGNRPIAWQKCLILSQVWSSRYERIVWVDADILINPSAPDVCYGVPAEKIGVVAPYGQFSTAELLIHHMRQDLFTGQSVPETEEVFLPDEINRKLAREHIDRVQLSEDMDVSDVDDFHILNTGVLVLSPLFHRSILEACYQYPHRTRSYEQNALSYLIYKNKLFFEINYRFNMNLSHILSIHYPDQFLVLCNQEQHRVNKDILEYALSVEFINSYFLHFCTLGNLFGLIDEVPCYTTLRQNHAAVLNRSVKIKSVS
ncbi:MAG: hypothetical protein HQL58_09140 [Magnetococcales bacterium]|nr:hypothetical protein [Magnetococcales bacterium]